jgi:O-antigen/teichoic acid export membrane protein
MSVNKEKQFASKTTIGGLSQVMVFRVGGMMLSLISMLIVPRMLGAALYGKYSFLVSNMALFLGFTELGVTGISGRYISAYNVEGDSDKVQKLFINLFIFKLLIGFIGALIFYLYIRLADPFGLSQGVILIFSANLLVSIASGPLFGLVYGLNRLGKWASRGLLDGGIRLIILIPFFLLFNLQGVATANLFSSLVVLVIGLNWCWEYIQPIWFNFDYAIPYLAFGLKLFLINVFVYIFQNSGVILSGFLKLPVEDLGNWSLASKILNMIIILCGTLMVSFTPTLTQYLVHERHDQTLILGRKVISIFSLFYMVSQAAILFLSEHFFQFLFGFEYSNVNIYLMVAFLGVLPFALVSWFRVFTVAIGKPMVILPPMVIMASSSVSLGYFLIPHLRGMGAALSFSLSLWLAVIGLFWTLKYIKIKSLWKSWMTPVVVGLGPLTGLWLLRGHLMVNISLFVVYLLTYGILLKIFGYSSFDDFVYLVRKIRRIGG